MSYNNRRKFLINASALAFMAPLLGFDVLQNAPKNFKKILFRASWDHTNSGDIADITSIYRLVQKFVADTQVILWPFDLDDSILDLLKKNFTSLKIVSGTIDEDGNPTSEELRNAIDEADLFIYSTGSERRVNWSGQRTEGIETASIKTLADSGIPIIIIGLGDIPEESTELKSFKDTCEKVSNVFIKDIRSEDTLKTLGIKLSNAETLPNPIVAFELKNDSESRKILADYKLSNTGFIIISVDSLNMTNESRQDLYEKMKIMVKTWLIEAKDDVLLHHQNPEEALTWQKDLKAVIESQYANRIHAIDRRIMPDTEISLIEKARICVGNNVTNALFSIQAKTPVYFMLGSDIELKENDATGLGLKDYVIKLAENTGETLSEGLLKINDNYLKAILDVSKARDIAYKKLEPAFLEINKLINKPTKKKKKN